MAHVNGLESLTSLCRCAFLQFDDQGIVNTDPRTIAVPDGFVNLAVTDVHGVAFAITPKQVRCLLILTSSSWCMEVRCRLLTLLN